MDSALLRVNSGSPPGVGIFPESIRKIIPTAPLTTVHITTAGLVRVFMSMSLTPAYGQATRNLAGELQGILTRWVAMAMTATVTARTWPASSEEASTA